MIASLDQQVLAFLQKPETKSVLICLTAHPSVDAITSALALLVCIEKMGKRATVVSSAFALPTHLRFLPESERITSALPAVSTMTIAVDISKTKADNVSYVVAGDKLLITLTPQTGAFQAQDVFATAGAAFDVIVTVGSPDFESLGQTFVEHADFFHRTTVINIDHTPANEQYGQVNLVNVNATSTAEVITQLVMQTFQSSEQSATFLDATTSTLLLCGMIAATRSFQMGAVTPQTLTSAANLITAGARREEIIRNLYQSQPLTTLRLWGRVCARLQFERDAKILWSKISHQDVLAAESSLDQLPGIIEALLGNTHNNDHVFILATTESGSVYGVLHTIPSLNAKELFADFLPEQCDHYIRFTQAQPMETIEQTILERLRLQQK